jgi:hypothetical protein
LTGSKKEDVPMATFPEDDIRSAKRFFDPDLVDAILTRAADIDFDEAYSVALATLINRLPNSSRFDSLAQQRRSFEAALLKEEVSMFKEIGRLLASIAARYEGAGSSRPAASLEGGSSQCP